MTELLKLGSVQQRKKYLLCLIFIIRILGGSRKAKMPRVWQGMGIDDKTQALYEYTKEVSEGFVRGCSCGDTFRLEMKQQDLSVEKKLDKYCKTNEQGSRAVREVSKEKKKDIKIVLHFTNPEKDGEYERYVQILQKQKVDYDIFASSYYPYWHGTVENFSSVLAKIKELSGKDVMCSEFSYFYTYDNADDFGNTISKDYLR